MIPQEIIDVARDRFLGKIIEYTSTGINNQPVVIMARVVSMNVTGWLFLKPCNAPSYCVYPMHPVYLLQSAWVVK